MKSPEQLKGAIRNISKKSGVNPNSLLQMFLFEGILEKLSHSKYKENFVLKGGLLISSLLGVDMRSTLDMDTTVVSLPINENNLTKIILEILDVPIDSNVTYELIKLEPIRPDDIYEDFCASIRCNYDKIRAILKIDITTGDIITPREIEYEYSKIFEEEKISLLAYPIETIIAEKFEAISSRGIVTTRLRDFYDLYMLYSIYESKISKNDLKDALINTSKNRGTYNYVADYKNIYRALYKDNVMHSLWDDYAARNSYAKDIKFNETLEIYLKIGDYILT